MQSHYSWNMTDSVTEKSPELNRHIEYDSRQQPQLCDPHHWRSCSEKPRKQSWTDLPQRIPMDPIPATILYPALTDIMSSSPESQSFASTITGYEHDSVMDCKFSPTLTDSSLSSSISTLPSTYSTSVTYSNTQAADAGSHMYWSAYNQPYNLPIHGDVCHDHFPTFWGMPSTDAEETASLPSSRGTHFSEDDVDKPESGEAIVKALLNRPRRTKTTTENAKFYCKICDKGFQRIYNLRSHMTKHEVSREKIRCSYPGCSKRFDRKTDLARHERSVHLHLREHQCVLCGSFFARKDTLVR